MICSSAWVCVVGTVVALAAFGGDAAAGGMAVDAAPFPTVARGLTDALLVGEPTLMPRAARKGAAAGAAAGFPGSAGRTGMGAVVVAWGWLAAGG